MVTELKKTLRRMIPARARQLRLAARHRRLFAEKDYREQFRVVHDKNLWGNPESVSGGGSTIDFTATLRPQLERWLADHDVTSMVDIPCGDFNWMRTVRFPDAMTYHGIDIVESLVEANQRAYGREDRRFTTGDVIKDDLPRADVYLCRDVFIHFPNSAVDEALANIRRTGSRWLIATTFPEVTTKVDTRFPFSRHQNLALFLGEPECLLDDSGGKVDGKYLGVWRLNA